MNPIFRRVASSRVPSSNTGSMVEATRRRTRSQSADPAAAAGDDDGAATSRPKKQTKMRTKKSKQTKDETKNGNPLDEPWYTMFTKGDEEYDAYMGREWGFEKVRAIRRLCY